MSNLGQNIESNNHRLAAEALQKLKMVITAEDRKAIDFLTDRTLEKYLAGNIADHGTATKIITVLSKRVAKRNRQIVSAMKSVQM